VSREAVFSKNVVFKPTRRSAFQLFCHSVVDSAWDGARFRSRDESAEYYFHSHGLIWVMAIWECFFKTVVRLVCLGTPLTTVQTKP
jgi:hypothetical protein